MNFKSSGFNFDNSYLNLNSVMYTKMSFKNTYNATIELLNENLASELGISIEYLKSNNGIKLLSGSTNDEYTSTYAQAYSGHQFGHLSVLGDGRALMLGEQITPIGARYDIQLKGSGRTPYSRSGDGKATLYSMLREYIISEAMYALDIPTTRTLSVLKTNEKVQRTTKHSGAILSRVAKSHIRFGTFTHALTHGGNKTVKELADYTINRHYKHLSNESDKYLRFLSEVLENQASLIAKWQSVGFIHGVLNTDNVLVSGETIDYGPCAFMNNYDPKTVFSSIDRNGRYSYNNQPFMMSWNLARFTETIMGLFDENKEIALLKANNELAKFEEVYNKEWLKHMGLKIGIENPLESDKILIEGLFELMLLHQEDFTNTFRFLTTDDYLSIKMNSKKEFKDWITIWKQRLQNGNVSPKEAKTIMMKNNPIIIPRNNLIEEALISASSDNDYTLFNEFLGLLNDPFNYKKEYQEKYVVANKEEDGYVTYCGT